MSFRGLGLLSMCVVSICAPGLHAATNIWLQTSNVAGAPSLLNLIDLPAQTGTLYLFGQSDDQTVADISFHIGSSNPAALSFTAPANYGPQHSTAWSFIGTPVGVTPGKVGHFGAVALPHPGRGFGPGTNVRNTMLLASVGYTLGAVGSTSTLSLILGEFGLTDMDGNPLSFRMGDPASALVNGFSEGASRTAGTVRVTLIPEPMCAVLVLTGTVATYLRRPKR